MLVLSRREGQRIIIGEGPDAVVLLVDLIDRNQVRLAFQAPRYIKIDREEVRRADEERDRDD